MDLCHWDFLLLLWGHSSSCKYNLHISTQLDLQQKHNNDMYIQTDKINHKSKCKDTEQTWRLDRAFIWLTGNHARYVSVVRHHRGTPTMMTTAAIDRAAIWPRLRSARHTQIKAEAFLYQNSKTGFSIYSFYCLFFTTLNQLRNTHIYIYIKSWIVHVPWQSNS